MIHRIKTQAVDKGKRITTAKCGAVTETNTPVRAADMTAWSSQVECPDCLGLGS